MTKTKYRTREEMVAAVKRAVERKRAWEEDACRNYVANRQKVGMPVLQYSMNPLLLENINA